jgi:hypothetical protein
MLTENFPVVFIFGIQKGKKNLNNQMLISLLKMEILMEEKLFIVMIM